MAGYELDLAKDTMWAWMGDPLDRRAEERQICRYISNRGLLIATRTLTLGNRSANAF